MDIEGSHISMKSFQITPHILTRFEVTREAKTNSEREDLVTICRLACNKRTYMSVLCIKLL